MKIGRRIPDITARYAGLITCIVLLCAAATDVSSAFPRNSIRDIRFSTHDTFTRVVIELDREFSFTRKHLKFPERLYFDLAGTRSASFRKKVINIGDRGVNSVKIGQFNPTTARVVLRLGSYRDYNVYTLENPPRLVVDVHYGAAVERFIPRKRVVVIDAGHGANDSGAIGRHGLKEKDVVLDIAKRLKRVLERKYAVKVYLTRSTDRYLELRERAMFANRLHADLFISIHANASRNRRVRGIETWFLNFTTNREYQKVAARENSVSLDRQKQIETVEAQILASLGSDLKRDYSIRLANYIQNSLIRNMRARYKRRIHDLGVKYARFYVLHTDMPSALVEVGFITNPEEERLLRRASYRALLASSIAKGINTFLSILPDMPKLARR